MLTPSSFNKESISKKNSGEKNTLKSVLNPYFMFIYA